MNGGLRNVVDPVPPSPCLRLRVKEVVRVNQGWAKIVLSGPELAGFVPTGIGCWVKVFIPGSIANTGRTFTVRKFDAAACELEIDVVRRRRANGMSQWIYEHLHPGDSVDIAGPRGGYAIDPECGWHVLLGDETALPAIYCLLNALPAQVRRTAIVEVPFPENAYASAQGIEFLLRGVDNKSPRSYLETAIGTIPPQVGRGRIWIAGEAGLIRRLKERALEQWRSADVVIEATGYWKAGHEDYRDEAVFPG